MLSIPRRFLNGALPPTYNFDYSYWWFFLFFLAGLGTMFSGLFMDDSCTEDGFNLGMYLTFAGVGMCSTSVLCAWPYAVHDHFCCPCCSATALLVTARLTLRGFFLSWFVTGVGMLNRDRNCLEEEEPIWYLACAIVFISALFGFCPLFKVD